MAELRPVPFADLVSRMFLELERQDAIFDLPRRKWFWADPTGPDLSVQIAGRTAGTPVGPAAGPHTQMAQNIVLSWLAGARVLELKTVQINDRLEIPRPCIDATNVCYNVEWSQELPLEASLEQYVAASMLIHMLRHSGFFGELEINGRLGETIYDLSVGYDLAGIQSRPMVDFLAAVQDAGAAVDRLRGQIPAAGRHLRELDYPRKICSGLTLSTFHGCPAEEIERICGFLLSEMNMDVVVKMNPPMLGREQLEHLLHDVLGYDEIKVRPAAYEEGLRFESAVQLCGRLAALARRCRRHFGVKFSNTLEVLNQGGFFTPQSEVMYLSGTPLHVIALTLADAFRQAVGPELPMSFSAGVDRSNFADMVACGFCPVTTCTDLLRPGGYARLPAYLRELREAMRRVGARNTSEFILRTGDLGAEHPPPPNATPVPSSAASLTEAAAQNLRRIAEQARRNPRYRAEKNRGVPKRLGSHLALFDCVCCDKCIPVCPNDANFSYRLAPQRIEFHDWVVKPDGSPKPGPAGILHVKREHQIGTFADFCNACGNCDTFCPEEGAPFKVKPNFFGSHKGWREAAIDGFYIETADAVRRIHGRMDGSEYALEHDTASDTWLFTCGGAIAVFASLAATPEILSWPDDGGRLDMRVFHILRLLMDAVLDAGRVNPVNTPHLAKRSGDAPG